MMMFPLTVARLKDIVILSSREKHTSRTDLSQAGKKRVPPTPTMNTRLRHIGELFLSTDKQEIHFDPKTEAG